MTRAPRVRGADLVRALERLGFVVDRQRGSHVHLRHRTSGARATVPIHAGREISPGLLHGVLKDAGVSLDELREVL